MHCAPSIAFKIDFLPNAKQDHESNPADMNAKILTAMKYLRN